MEIIKNFGLNPLLIAAQIVNFLILVYLLNRFFFKRVLSLLKKREEKIKSGLEAAEKGEEILVKAQVSKKEILSSARAEAQTVLQNTQKRGEEIVQSTQLTARQQAEKIIAEAKKQAEEEKIKLEQELKKQTTHIAVSILGKALQDILTVDEQKRIMTKLASGRI